MKSFVVFLWACTLLVSFAAGASGAPVSAQEATARKVIDAGNHRYLATLVAADAKGFAGLYAVDGIQMPSSGAPIARGRSTIAAQTAADFKTTTYLSGNIVTTNVAVFGAMAYETGRYSFAYREKGKQAAVTTGRYFVAWERQSDGSYLIKVDAGFPAACPR